MLGAATVITRPGAKEPFYTDVYHNVLMNEELKVKVMDMTF
jgi:hypothetical protein